MEATDLISGFTNSCTARNAWHNLLSLIIIECNYVYMCSIGSYLKICITLTMNRLNRYLYFSSLFLMRTFQKI